MEVNMHINPRRIAPFVIIIALTGVAIWYFWGQASQPENGSLTASGTIEANEVNLASESGGKVVAVRADEGDEVIKDQILVEFDDLLLKAQLDQAKAAVSQAQANYDLVASGLPVEQQQLAISTAKMEGLSAQQALDDIYQNVEIAASLALQEIAQADNAIDQATKRIDTLNSPADQADIDEAKAAVVLARDRLDKAQDKFEPYEKKREDNVTRATLLSRVAEAQNYYDTTVTRLNNLIGTANELDLALAEADLTMAEAQKEDAERRYAALVDGPDPDDVAMAEARLETARANLEAASADPSQEQLAAAQAQIDSAKAAMNVLESQIDKLTLSSVIDGIVLERTIDPGEIALPGTPLFVLADLEDLTITVYVAEDRYGEITLGQTAWVNVDSFPGESFPALVVHIADQAEYTPRNVQTEEGRRSTVFAVNLNLENPEGKLKPGMPADVSFDQRLP
jgi:HlyD family secretion protein